MIVNIIDWIFIFALLLPVLYLFVFAAFSMQRRREPYPPARKQRRFVTLIPAYYADAVVVRTAQAALERLNGLRAAAVSGRAIGSARVEDRPRGLVCCASLAVSRCRVAAAMFRLA